MIFTKGEIYNLVLIAALLLVCAALLASGPTTEDGFDPRRSPMSVKRG